MACNALVCQRISARLRQRKTRFNLVLQMRRSTQMNHNQLKTVDRDPVRHLDTVFAIADRYGVEVDIHLHEPGTLGAFAVELIAERTKVLGLQGRVTISLVS